MPAAAAGQAEDETLQALQQVRGALRPPLRLVRPLPDSNTHHFTRLPELMQRALSRQPSRMHAAYRIQLWPVLVQVEQLHRQPQLLDVLWPAGLRAGCGAAADGRRHVCLDAQPDGAWQNRRTPRHAVQRSHRPIRAAHHCRC